MSKIRNILFDMGGVLADLDRDAVVAEFARLGFPEADGLLNNYRQKGIFKELEQGTASPEELYEYIGRHTGLDIAPEQIDHALGLFIETIPEYKLEMLLQLRRRFGVFLLSNISSIIYRQIEERFLCRGGRREEDYFDGVFLSCRLKMLKPDPEIYQAVLEQAGIKAGETLFIDDNQANIDAGKAAGFHTYLAKEREDFRHIFGRI